MNIFFFNALWAILSNTIAKKNVEFVFGIDYCFATIHYNKKWTYFTRCTQTIAFFFAAVFYSSPYKQMLNILVVMPILLIVDKYVYYMLACPCLKSKSQKDLEKRRRSIIRYCLCLMEGCGKIATGLLSFNIENIK